MIRHFGHPETVSMAYIRDAARRTLASVHSLFGDEAEEVLMPMIRRVERARYEVEGCGNAEEAATYLIADAPQMTAHLAIMLYAAALEMDQP